MAQIYISIGSNIDPAHNVCEGIRVLRDHYGDLSVSSVYESAAIGFAGNNFYNLVVGAITEEPVEIVVTALREIEDNHGRDRSGPHFSSRTLDLDLLMYDDLVIKQPQLELPRAEIIENAFVLWPLAEIAPELIHPNNNKTMEQLWEEFDKDSQELWPIDLRCE